MLQNLARVTSGFDHASTLHPVNSRSQRYRRIGFLLLFKAPHLVLDVLHVPDHDEAPVVAADQPAGVEVETADRVGVTSQYTELLPRPDPAPEDDLAVEAGRPEAEG